MKFIEFEKAFASDNVIDIHNVAAYFKGLDRRRLYEWQKKGYLVKLVPNFYLFSGNPVDDTVLKNIACRVYSPAYIGLESALAWHNFIPEAVFQITGITTRRAKTIRTPVGDFRYRSVKPGLFFGYDTVDKGNSRFFISNPEKTLLDFFYFFPGPLRAETLAETRFNFTEIRQKVDAARMRGYLTLFASPKLNRAVKLLMEKADVEF